MPKAHESRNIKRFCEMLGIKQEVLSAGLGEDRTQKRISLLGQKEITEPAIFGQVAKVLNVPAVAIRNLNEDQAIHNIQNNYDSTIVNADPTINYKFTFNPLDKWAEEITENRKLYELLLQTQKEKITLL